MKSERNPGMRGPAEKIYDRLVPLYDYLFGKLAFDEGRKLSVQLLAPKDKERFLEVGVGTGLTLPHYPPSCHVTGIDLSEGMLEQARELIAKRQLKNCEVLKMDVTHLPFDEASFDGVLGSLFLSATHEPLKALLEMKRVLKPDGRMVLMNHFKSENPVIGKVEEWLDPITQNIGFTSCLELLPLVEKAGLQIEHIEKTNFMRLWTAVRLKKAD